MTDSQSSKRHFWINILILSLVFLFARRDIIRWSSLDEDELISWSLIKLPWKEFFAGIYHDTQQPLFYVLLKVVHLIIPLKTDAALRAVSLFFSVGTIQIFYFYLSRHFKALIAGLVVFSLICHPDFKFYSVYARPYSLLYLLSALNAVCFLELFFHENKTSWLRSLFCLSLVAMFFTHYLSYFYTGALGIAALFFPGRGIFRGWSVKQLCFLGSSLLAIAITTLYQWQFRSFIHWVPASIDSTLISLRLFFGAPLSFPTTLILFFLAFFLIFLYRQSRSTEESKKELLFCLAALSAGLGLFGLFSMVALPLFVSKYLFILFPFSFLLLSHMLSFYQIEKHPGFFIALALLSANFRGLEKSENAWKFDAKEFFKEIKERHLVSEDNKILCNTPRGPHKIFSGYSEVYFNKDICETYRFDTKAFDEKAYPLIINMKTLPADEAFKSKASHYLPLFSTRDLELLKRID